MKKIEAYELTNGVIYTDKEQAIKAQKIIDIEKDLQPFIKKFDEDLVASFLDRCQLDAVIQIFIKSHDELYQVLKKHAEN